MMNTAVEKSRDSFPSLQGLSIRYETSAAVIRSTMSAQTADWWQSRRAWVLLRRHVQWLVESGDAAQAKR